MAAVMEHAQEERARVRVHVRGVVQGVGFRPFVHSIATGLGLAGTVGNGPDGVTIEVEGAADTIAVFLRRLQNDAPPLAVIESVSTGSVEPSGEEAFRIVGSEAGGAGGAPGATTLVPPDVAPCVACLAEIDDPAARRHRYPITTWTHCGPRFTIIDALPYDRPRTSMAGFPLCPACAAEYADPSDRRFHAQPLACPACGPQLAFRRADAASGGSRRAEHTGEAALAAAQRMLAAGGIVAVKGVGGFHLACDAADPGAVDELRRRKGRRGKPFAVLARDLAAVRSFALVSAAEAELLTGRIRPIVLLAARSDSPIPANVAPGNGRVGVMLPPSPLHHLLFRPEAAAPGHDGARVSDLPDLPAVLVLTSGNVSDEPICVDDDEAFERLDAIADAFLFHDRPIRRPVDDSVVRFVSGGELPIRRSRGYAPFPVTLPFAVPPLVATGAELKTAACVASGRHAWLSQHLGDMGSLVTLEAFNRTVEDLSRLQDIMPGLVAVDAHPDFLTSRWGRERAAAHGLDLVDVQHHHAHVAACMAEHGVALGTTILGLAFDGTGYGPDGTIWGGEALAASYTGFRRVAHLAPIALPGGDAAIERPRRTALAHLHAAGVAWHSALPPVGACDDVERRVLARQFDRGFGTVATTSMGRLFDAVASLIGLRHEVTYEAQAAIELEAIATVETSTPYRFAIRSGRAALSPLVADAAPVIAAIADDVLAHVEPARIAAWFHLAVADLVTDLALRLRDEHGDVLALTGGVFQNVTLLEACRDRLDAHGITVLCHRTVPPNDGGLALGQAVIAGARAVSGRLPDITRPDITRPDTTTKETR